MRAALVALLVACALAYAGCAAAVPTGDPFVTGVDITNPPPQPTPWPNGTVGRYGLRVDPALLARLPSSVGGISLVEAPQMELAPLDDPDVPATVESFAAAAAGTYEDPDWLTVTVMRLRLEASGEADYVTLRDQLVDGACSQAGGVDPSAGNPSSEVIAGRTVDVAKCVGEPIAYTVKLDQRTLVSVLAMGDRQLGRQLLEAIP